MKVTDQTDPRKLAEDALRHEDKWSALAANVRLKELAGELLKALDERDRLAEKGEQIAEAASNALDQMRQERDRLEWALRFYVKGEDGGETARAALAALDERELAP